MSKYVEEIIEDLKKNPENYRDYYGNGVEKDNIRISGYGSMLLTSVIRVTIYNNTVPTSIVDNWKLARAIRKWYRTIPLKVLMV
ncbi:MAG: hypothetical protein ACOH2D_09970 [Gelidibacter sp.]